MYQHILIPIDGSHTSLRALQEAIRLAGRESKLRLVYVLEETYLDAEAYTFVDYGALQTAVRHTGERILAQEANRALQAGVVVETALLEAGGERIASVIVEDAKLWNADLIVIGTHGRSGLSRLLLGSVAEGVVRIASMPVLLVRNE
jgi:nucleotide-binding universal stress UspA family protein